jgi:hypothetical protein
MEIKDFKLERRTTRSRTVVINYNPNSYKINTEECMKKDENVNISRKEIIDAFKDGCPKKRITVDVKKDDTVDCSSANRSMICGILGQQLKNMKKSVNFALRKKWPYSMYFRGCIEDMENEPRTNTNLRESFHSLIGDGNYDKIEYANNSYSKSLPSDSRFLDQETTKVLKDIANTYISAVDEDKENFISSGTFPASNANTRVLDSSDISFKDKIRFFENISKNHIIIKTNKRILGVVIKDVTKPTVQKETQSPGIIGRSFDFKSLLRKWEISSAC